LKEARAKIINLDFGKTTILYTGLGFGMRLDLREI